MSRWRVFNSVLYTALSLLAAISSYAQDNNGTNEVSVELRVIDANPNAYSKPLKNLPVDSFFFNRFHITAGDHTKKPVPKSWYKDIYPGIDLLCFGDSHNLEYVYVVNHGGDVSLIKMNIRGIDDINQTQQGNLQHRFQGGEIIQSIPVIYLESEGRKQRLYGNYNISHRDIEINPGREYLERSSLYNGTKYNIVPSGGQPGGPRYNYYVSKYEVTNEQFRRFLNSIDSNRDKSKKNNIFIDNKGNVWMHPEMKIGGDEIFSIRGSQLIYDPRAPEGERYTYRKKNENEPDPVDFPITGVSWFGAVKYCNWMTTFADRGEAELCYTEGTNSIEWMPVTATNWPSGRFGYDEREILLNKKGFRLMMVYNDFPTVATNAFNEFYKAAAWQEVTNKLYAFGRNKIESIDANTSETSVLRGKYKTLPVGFFDGVKLLMQLRTRANENFYGVSDLTGNVAEWMNDPGRFGDITTRLVCGGAWNEEATPVTVSKATPPYSTGTGNGFRTCTTYMPEETLYIHILFSFYMEPPPPPPPEDREPLLIERGDRERPEDGQPSGKPTETFPLVPDTSIDTPGITYKQPPGTISGGGGGGGGVPIIGGGGGGPVFPPVLPPIVIGGGGGVPPVNTTLNVNALDSSGVPLSAAIDTIESGVTTTFFTPYSRTYTPPYSVTLIANPVAGYTFLRWMEGAVTLTTNTTVIVDMATSHTVTAVYQPPVPLTVELGWSASENAPLRPPALPVSTNSPAPTAIATNYTWLVATPRGGTGVYTHYAYEYKFDGPLYTNTQSWNPGTNTTWFTSATNRVWFWKDVQFRVTVYDGVTNALSNIAYLYITPTNVPWPHDGTRVKP